MADNWPLRSYLALGALPSAVPCARLHARHLLWEWGQATLTDSAQLVVAELVTNAVTASQAMEWPQPVRLYLHSDRTRLLVLVWDARPHPPERIDADDHAESGRGLLLVDAVSEQWNWYPTRETGGKVVWSLIHLMTAAEPECPLAAVTAAIRRSIAAHTGNPRVTAWRHHHATLIIASVASDAPHTAHEKLAADLGLIGQLSARWAPAKIRPHPSRRYPPTHPAPSRQRKES